MNDSRQRLEEIANYPVGLQFPQTMWNAFSEKPRLDLGEESCKPTWTVDEEAADICSTFTDVFSI